MATADETANRMHDSGLENRRAAEHPLEVLARVEATSPRQRRGWALWLLLVPVVVALAVPFYNRDAPRLGGIPFFLWFQMALVVFGAVVTGIVYLLRGIERSL